MVFGWVGFGWYEVAHQLVLGGESAVVGKCAAGGPRPGLLSVARDIFGGVVAECHPFFVGVVGAACLHLLFPFLGDGVAAHPRRLCLFSVVEAALRHSAFPFAPVGLSAFFAFQVPVVVFSAVLVYWRV